MANDFSSDSSWVAVYRMESGALFTDSTVNGNTLTDYNTVNENTTDFVEGACSADFESGLAERMYSTDTSLSSNFPGKSGTSNTDVAISSWIRNESTPSDGVARTICAKWRADGYRSWKLFYRNVGGVYSIVFQLGYNSGGSYEDIDVLTLSQALTDETWYYVGFSYDDSTKGWYVTLWEKGTPDTQIGENSGTTTNNMSVDSGHFSIGCSYSNFTAGADYWDGELDEVAIANSPKTEADFDAIRAGTYSAGGVPTTETKTVNLDALIQKTLSAQASLDAYLQKSIPVTLSIDALIQALYTSGLSLDALAVKTGSGELSIDAMLNRIGIETSLSIDALVTKTYPAALSLDAILYALSAGERSLSIDALVQQAGVIATVNLDALAYKSIGLGADLDGVLVKTLAQSLLMDALVQKQGLTRAAVIDAQIFKLQSISTALDAVIGGGGTLPVELDALLTRLNNTQIASLDAMLYQGRIAEISLDAIVSGTLGKTVNIDALLNRSAVEAGVLLDAIIYSALVVAKSRYAFVVSNARPSFSLSAARPSFAV